jgi:hypothetical protein
MLHQNEKNNNIVKYKEKQIALRELLEYILMRLYLKLTFLKEELLM